MMGFVFWNIILNAEKLSKPDTYPRFVKLAKNIVSHSLSKTSFCSVRVFRKSHFRFLNVYIRCLWTTIVYFAIFKMMFQSQGKRVKIALFCNPKNFNLVHFLKINFLYPGKLQFPWNLGNLKRNCCSKSGCKNYYGAFCYRGIILTIILRKSQEKP
jgi:hypothetical protein